MAIFKIEETNSHKILTIFSVKIKFKKISNNKIVVVSSTADGIKTKVVKKIKGLKIKFDGCDSDVIIHSPIPRFRNCSVSLKSSSKIEILSSKYKINSLYIDCQGNTQYVNIGSDFSCSGNCKMVFSKEENIGIEIGDDCMFSNNIIFRPSDGHTIIDLNVGTVINRGKTIIVKDHVWLGLNTILLKGAVVSKNCIIGAGSIVSNPCIEENSIYVGTPAKKIKTNINWDRETIPDYEGKINK